MRIKGFLVCLLAMGSLGFLQAQPTQDKAQLEKERQDIQTEIQQLQGMYDKIKGQTKLSLGQLNMLQKKINLQERFVGSINKELRMIDDDIYRSNLEIYRLQKQMDTLKSQYAHSVVYAYKNRSTYDYLNFIFSASSFNDAIKRIAYLKSYRSYREKQVNTILETKQLIAQRKQQQLGRKDQKNQALQNETKQITVLDEQRKEKDAIVSRLKGQEKDLQKQLTTKKKRVRDLNNTIVAIVRRELENAKKEADAIAAAEAKKNGVTNPTTTPTTGNPDVTTSITSRNKPATKPASYLDLNAKDIALNADFKKNQGRLPWPVDNGVVIYHYGINKVESTLLTFDSPGLTIATPSAGATVKAVFDGEVSVVNNNGDGSSAVIVRHGKYFSVYSNLVSVNVNKGSIIKTGESIGKAGRNDEGNGGQVDFILMNELKNVNPELWLRR